MVVALGPGKFYGSSLPRPRFYTDSKLNDDRVDPPIPVLDPLMSWAEEAHWSMGGLSHTRLRLQGRIEGSIKKLRAEREKFFKKTKQNQDTSDRNLIDEENGSDDSRSPSPPPAPMALKRRRFRNLVDVEEDEREEDDKMLNMKGGIGIGIKRRLTRRLGDDFDRVAAESGMGERRESPVKGGLEGVALRTRSRSEEGGEGVEVVNGVGVGGKLKLKGKKVKGNEKRERGSKSGGTRTSPRLAKRGSP